MPRSCAKHHSESHPNWADPALYSPEAAENIRDWDKWTHIQQMLELMSRHLSIHVLIVSLDGFCVCGTGRYYNGIRFKVPHDSTLNYTLRTKQSTLMLNPGAHNVCQSGSRKFDCDDVASFSGPIILDGKNVAVTHIAAFSLEQRAELLASWSHLFELLTGMVRFVFMSSEKKFLAAFEQEQSTPEFSDLVGQSPSMLQLRKCIAKLATSDFPVLVHGESGTGKELVARSIHERSRRAESPFVAVNCGAIPESLMESVLFGYEHGAFSGACAQGKQGLFEEADGGTFFMDEVSEMPQAMQVKLLRVLQEKKVLRLGGKQTRHVDFRLIAATNRNMREMVTRGEFREDLFFRLDVLPVRVPPLRERTEDIPLLTLHYLEKFRRESGRSFRMTTELLQYMGEYHWPGNGRELINMLWYGVTFSITDVLTLESLADRFHSFPVRNNFAAALAPAPVARVQNSGQDILDGREPSRRQTRLMEKRERYLAVLSRHADTTEGKREAAKELGVSLATLYRGLRNATSHDE